MPLPSLSSLFFVVARNPFEMAVSSLAYDLEPFEPFEFVRFSSLELCLADVELKGIYTLLSVFDDGTPEEFCPALVQVAVAARTYLKGVLPPPGNETCELLPRVLTRHTAPHRSAMRGCCGEIGDGNGPWREGHGWDEG